jgi:3-hydroxyisobutyrate dehydrogenase
MTAPRIGFIGLGNLGRPMAERLVAAGLQPVVWNRDPAKAAGLGATLAASPRALAEACDIIALCVLDGAAVEAVVFGPNGIAEAPPAGRLLVDFSTIDPEATRAMAEMLRQASGMGWVDAPVSGGVPGAVAGSLIVFAGGDPADVARATPLFQAVSRRVTQMGPIGAGQTTKLCNQLLVAVNVLTLAETFALARRTGVDVTQLAPALAGGFADTTPLQIFGPRMAAHQFTPRQSAIALMGKDIGLAQELARRSGAATPVSALCSALYQAARLRPDIDYTADVSELVRLYEP